jgi:hypothetical protein
MSKKPKRSDPFETAEVPERALRIYARLWQLETWLRRMVYVELRALKGDAWRKSLPKESRSLQADKHLKHMPTPEMNALSYAPLSKLAQLIEAHWSCFEAYFPPLELWQAKLKEISQIRHRIAHFRVGHADDYPRVLQFLRDIDRGLWTFCTSYNDARPILPQSDDVVTAHFLHLDPLPWREFDTKKWARVGRTDKSAVIGMTVEVLTRPWATLANQIDGTAGHFYDIRLMAHDRRKFDYGKFLDRSRHLHNHVAHLCLSSFEETFRLTVPAVLGSARVIELIDAFLEIARYNVRRSASVIEGQADSIAAEWPEYVLGPSDPLTFLDPEMKCAFFGA